MSRSATGMVFVLGLVYLYFSSLPVWHTDVWGHLSYGRVIWQTRSLPATEPLLPLSRGTPFVDSAWLSQLVGIAIVSDSCLKISGLQGLLGIGVTSCGGMLCWSTYRQTRNVWFSLAALILFLIICWSPLTVLRPQLAGLACFILVLTRVPFHSKFDWILVPIVFVFWANLHGSFLVGLGLLACVVVGHASDLLIRTRSFGKAIASHRGHRLLMMTLVAAAAVLLNPYTIRLYFEVFPFSSNENLQDLTEWQPLNVREPQGLIFTAVSFLLMATYRWSPRRIRSWETFALLGLGFATLWSARMIVWWGPVAALLLARHGFAIWRRFFHAPLMSKQMPGSVVWTLTSIGLTLMCFLYSPLGNALIYGKHAETRRSVSSYTPLFAAEYLRQHRPIGQVFNTYEWGDYLQWAGPENMQLFVNSHAHLVPRDVWLAYMQVTELRSGWEQTLDQYGINTIVVDRENRERLIQALLRDTRWQSPPVERDGQVIFSRLFKGFSGLEEIPSP
jgi:hypothetical protein